MSRSLILALALPCFACAGDDPSGAGESGETGDTETGDTTDTDTGDTTDTDTGDTGEDEPRIVGEPTIIHHPKQPMVIDLIVELDAPGTGELVHAQDDDVRVVLLDPGPDALSSTLHFRVRGLAPDATHPLELDVHGAQSDSTDSWAGDVTTDEALPGFIAKFGITTNDASLVDDDLRLFDMAPLFTTEPSGVFMVDTVGTTRWYLGDADEFTGIDDIWSGLALRPDGSVSYVRRNIAYVIDELGELQMEVSADSLGAPAGFHHDLTELPNGNFIVLGYSFRDVEYEGEGTLHVAGDMIYEFTPSGELVWTWDSFDHLDPQRRRADFFSVAKIPDPDSDEDGHDWTHGNGLVHTADDDMILFSMRHQDWIVAIDHATGDIVWRLGDEGDFALEGDDQWFFHQHSAQWQPDGSLLLYDNAVGNPAQDDTDAHSRAVRYQLDQDTMTATLLWADDDPKFISDVAGDADRTSDGHVLRLDSTWHDAENTLQASRLRELDPERTPNAIWTLSMPPGYLSYRAVPLARWVGEAAP